MPDGKILVLNIDMLYEIGIQWLNTMILIFVLTKLLYKPVSKFMKKRSERIESEINEANRLKEEAITMKNEYEEKLKGIKEESNAIIETAHKKAVENEMQIMDEARGEAEALKVRTTSEIDKMKSQIREEMKKEIVEVSALMTKKIIRDMVDDNKKEEILDETIKEMENLKWLA